MLSQCRASASPSYACCLSLCGYRPKQHHLTPYDFFPLNLFRAVSHGIVEHASRHILFVFAMRGFCFTIICMLPLFVCVHRPRQHRAPPHLLTPYVPFPHLICFMLSHTAWSTLAGIFCFFSQRGASASPSYHVASRGCVCVHRPGQHRAPPHLLTPSVPFSHLICFVLSRTA